MLSIWLAVLTGPSLPQQPYENNCPVRETAEKERQVNTPSIFY